MIPARGRSGVIAARDWAITRKPSPIFPKPSRCTIGAKTTRPWVGNKKIPTGHRSVRGSGGFEREEVEEHAWQHPLAKGGNLHACPSGNSGYGRRCSSQDPRPPP